MIRLFFSLGHGGQFLAIAFTAFIIGGFAISNLWLFHDKMDWLAGNCLAWFLVWGAVTSAVRADEKRALR